MAKHVARLSKMINAYRIKLNIFKRRDIMGDLGVNKRITLE
jgi:hypothetical protein